MSTTQSTSLPLEIHSCLWCRRLQLDFSSTAKSTLLPIPAELKSITVPMPFEGVNVDIVKQGEFIKRMNEFLSLSAADGCAFSQLVLKTIGASDANLPVVSMFSWIGGIEFIGLHSSICLSNCYWYSSDSNKYFLDPKTYRIPSNALRRAKSWLRNCEESHLECQLLDDPMFVPQRLLRISRIDDKWCVRLTYPKSRCIYSALSYCWGRGPNATCTNANVTLWESSGPTWGKLPRLIQDAILVTFVLGIEFIWIDSMCVLQDNNYDKEVQIAQMPRIYNSAILTLSAAGMSGVHDPLFRTLRKPISHAKSIFKLPSCGAPDSIDGAILAPLHELEVTSMEEDIAAEPLDRRAWTFQESLLSRRLLKFTSSTMRWECWRHLEIDFDDGKRTRILDCFPLHPAVCRMRHRSNLNYILRSGNLHCPDGRQSDIPVTGFDQPDIYPWHTIVEEYTRRSLSFPNDRALAISGVAERIARKTDDLYYAGLWESCLVSQLAWYDSSPESISDPKKATKWVLSSIRIMSAESHPGCRTHQWGGAFSLPIGDDQDSEQDMHALMLQPEEKPKELNSPSWSWISNSGPVRFKVSGMRFTLEIVSVVVQYSLEDAPFGNVDYGQLTVRGSVKSTTHAQCIGQDLPFNSTVSDSMLLLKLGEEEFPASDVGGRAVCLELKQKTDELWVRIGLSEVRDTDWIETRTITIV